MKLKPLQISTHALKRAAERFPDKDIESSYRISKKCTRKWKKKIRKSCPKMAGKWMNGFNGRFFSHAGDMVFVMQAPNILVTILDKREFE